MRATSSLILAMLTLAVNSEPLNFAVSITPASHTTRLTVRPKFQFPAYIKSQMLNDPHSPQVSLNQVATLNFEFCSECLNEWMLLSSPNANILKVKKIYTKITILVQSKLQDMAGHVQGYRIDRLWNSQPSIHIHSDTQGRGDVDFRLPVTNRMRALSLVMCADWWHCLQADGNQGIRVCDSPSHRPHNNYR